MQCHIKPVWPPNNNPLILSIPYWDTSTKCPPYMFILSSPTLLVCPKYATDATIMLLYGSFITCWCFLKIYSNIYQNMCLLWYPSYVPPVLLTLWLYLCAQIREKLLHLFKVHLNCFCILLPKNYLPLSLCACINPSITKW